jgi:hypothetical protein
MRWIKTILPRIATARASLFTTALLALALALPAAAETLAGVDVKLEEGSIVPAAVSVLANPSETLRLERGLLGQLGAGRSSGASGVELTGGVLPVPEPGAVLLWAAGLLGLLALSRFRPVSVESEVADVATQGEPS